MAIYELSLRLLKVDSFPFWEVIPFPDFSNSLLRIAFLLQHEPETEGSFQFWHSPNEELLCAAKVETSEFPVQTRRRSQMQFLKWTIGNTTTSCWCLKRFRALETNLHAFLRYFAKHWEQRIWPVTKPEKRLANPLISLVPLQAHISNDSSFWQR
jgi:hypothetical protein